MYYVNDGIVIEVLIIVYLTVMRIRRNVDDPDTGRGALEFWEEQQRQKEVPEVVRLQLLFNAILSFLKWAHHHPCIVDDHVDVWFGSRQRLGTFSDACETREIQLANGQLTGTAVELRPFGSTEHNGMLLLFSYRPNSINHIAVHTWTVG